MIVACSQPGASPPSAATLLEPSTKPDDKWSGQVLFGTGGVRPTALGGPASPAPTGGDVDAASIKRPPLQCLRRARRAASHEFDRFGAEYAENASAGAWDASHLPKM